MLNDELVAHQLNNHDKRLDDHSSRLDTLEQSRAAIDVRVDNLCDKLEAQVKSINWLMGLLASGLLGFFIFAIQQDVFK